MTREPQSSPPVWPYAALAAALVMVAGLAIVGFLVLDSRLDAALTALEQEQDATRQRGDKPVAPAPEELAGDPPPAGKPGRPGRPGRDGADGVDGRDGRDGEDGADGADGVDGQDGADGADGADGQDGAKGEKGDDAEPAASYRQQDRWGDWHTCRRDEGSPDSAPTYTCTRDDRPGPVP